MKKKIIVTGASSGIGLAIAKELKKKGHLVIINGRNKKKLIKVYKAENFYDFQQGDLSRPNEAKRVVVNSFKKLKGLDVVVCNAGESKSCSPNKENCLSKIFIQLLMLLSIQRSIWNYQVEKLFVFLQFVEMN